MEEWPTEELHDPSLCFFCKSQASAGYIEVELHRLLKRSTQIASYVSRYATMRVRIPACGECKGSRDNAARNFRSVRIGTWIVSLLLLSVGLEKYVDEVGFAWFLGLVLATLLNSLLSLLVYTVFWGNRRVPASQPSPAQYPVVRRLIQGGWQEDIPNAKYGVRHGEDLDDDELRKLYRFVSDNAQSTMEDFEQASRRKFQFSSNTPTEG